MLVVYWRVSYSCKCDSRLLWVVTSHFGDKRLCECKRRAYGWCLMKRCTFFHVDFVWWSTFSRGWNTMGVKPATWGSTAISARLGCLWLWLNFFLVVSLPNRRLCKLLLPINCWGFENLGGANRVIVRALRIMSERLREQGRLRRPAGARTGGAVRMWIFWDLLILKLCVEVRCKLLLLISVCFLFPRKQNVEEKTRTAQSTSRRNSCRRLRWLQSKM